MKGIDMPQEHSAKKSAIGHNNAVEREARKPEKQAIAIAFETQREAKKNDMNPSDGVGKSNQLAGDNGYRKSVIKDYINLEKHPIMKKNELKWK